MATAVAHPMGFATGDIYFEDASAGRVPIELELVLDAPDDELGVANDAQRAKERRLRLVARVTENVHLLQDDQKLSKRVQVLSLGEGSSAVDVLRIRANAEHSKHAVWLQVGEQIDDLVLKVHRQESPVVQELWVTSGAESVPLSFEPPTAASSPRPTTSRTSTGSERDAATGRELPAAPSLTFLQAVRSGFAHILPLGFDHVVFILGLFFLSNSLRLLVIELSLFTLAHSVTLALGAKGLVDIAPSVAEPLIALSILLIGLEPRFAAWLDRRGGRLPWRVNIVHLRSAVVFAFGLLHGLGFASVFGRVGTQGDTFMRTLLGFNLGVELGQLAVVAGALVVSSPFRGRASYATRFVPIACTSVAILGGLWFLERVLA